MTKLHIQTCILTAINSGNLGWAAALIEFYRREWPEESQ